MANVIAFAVKTPCLHRICVLCRHHHTIRCIFCASLLLVMAALSYAVQYFYRAHCTIEDTARLLAPALGVKQVATLLGLKYRRATLRLHRLEH